MKNYIKNISGVQRLIQYSSVFDGSIRELTITFTVLGTDGETVEGTV